MAPVPVSKRSLDASCGLTEGSICACQQFVDIGLELVKELAL